MSAVGKILKSFDLRINLGREDKNNIYFAKLGEIKGLFYLIIPVWLRVERVTLNHQELVN